MDRTITRRFHRPHDHGPEALAAELDGVTVPWRIYGTDIGPSGRRYHVEFRMTNGMTQRELDESLEKINPES